MLFQKPIQDPSIENRHTVPFGFAEFFNFCAFAEKNSVSLTNQGCKGGKSVGRDDRLWPQKLCAAKKPANYRKKLRFLQLLCLCREKRCLFGKSKLQKQSSVHKYGNPGPVFTLKNPSFNLAPFKPHFKIPHTQNIYSYPIFTTIKDYYYRIFVFNFLFFQVIFPLMEFCHLCVYKVINYMALNNPHSLPFHIDYNNNLGIIL